jgi:hypothetical protein
MNSYFDDHKRQDGLGRQSLRGGAISIIARAINALVQVASLLLLARLLMPEDYGLVAMVTAFTGFAPLLVDLGTRDAIVQRVSITEGEVSALSWLNVGVGCAFALAISASGPLIAVFYQEPRLTAVVRMSSLTFVAVALTAQHEALIRRGVSSGPTSPRCTCFSSRRWPTPAGRWALRAAMSSPLSARSSQERSPLPVSASRCAARFSRGCRDLTNGHPGCGLSRVVPGRSRRTVLGDSPSVCVPLPGEGLLTEVAEGYGKCERSWSPQMIGPAHGTP